MNTEYEDSVLPEWKMPWMGKVAVIFIVAFFITVPMCTVITGFDDADVAQAESTAEVAKINTRAEVDKQKVEVVERLITDYNFSPMAARCVVYGWTDGSERELCMEASEEQARKQ